MRWNISYFGVKDLFTIINLLGGVFGIYFALEGDLTYAGYAIFAGYIFGDAVDGTVARLTHTSNKFGSEFDAAADHLSQGIAPTVIAYVAFTMAGHQRLGLVVMAFLMTTASIRMARFQVAEFNYPLTYCGLPRTVSGLLTISVPNATIFFKYSVIPYEGLAALLILAGILNLCPIPYMTHKGRKLQLWLKPFVVAFLVVPFVLLAVAPQFVYDFLAFVTFGYMLTAWIPLLPEERREFWAEYKRWSREVAARK